MSFRLKAMIKRGTDTIQRTNLTTTNNSEVYRTNPYMDTDFFEGDNYKSIIQCLNEG